MRRAHQVIRSHTHFFVITTLLIIVMTFPTIVFVFRTDEFRLPTGNSTDVFIHIWDIWYGKQILSGQADRFYTDLLFYPEGVSLVYHPIYGFPLNIALQSALQSLMPVSNAFSLTYLLVVFSNASAAYIYALWLFEDRWIALFGALVFGLQPHSLTLPNFLHGSTIVTIPLTFYCLHRGIRERSTLRIVLAGLLAGLTATISLYTFACLILTLAAGVCAFAVSRWRDRRFWLNIGLLAIIAAVSSFSAIYPVLADSQSLDAAIAWHGSERSVDFLSAIINRDNPFIGAFLVSIFNTPAEAEIVGTGYLGYLPLVLIGSGLLSKTVRRKMLPWLILFLGFYTLTLGSTLSVNGVNLPEILLPKHFLNEIVPVIFKAFSETRIFQIGVLLPLSVLACYGLAGLREARPIAGRSWFILLLLVLLAVEYYIPTRERVIIDDQIAYNDWLADEDIEIRLINLPMGRNNSKLYNLYQSFNGYPQVEGAISRTPDEAFNYIRSNFILGAWYKSEPVSCLAETKVSYLSALDRLEADGFTHVVFHRHVGKNESRVPIVASLAKAVPAYEDDAVSIFRIHDLRDSCPM